MALLANINRYRLNKARRQLPLILYQRQPGALETMDSKIHRALGLMLADQSLSNAVKISELKRTLNLYRQVAESLKQGQS